MRVQTGLILDVRAAIRRGDVAIAITVIGDYPLRDGWSRVLEPAELEQLRAAGWKGDR